MRNFITDSVMKANQQSSKSSKLGTASVLGLYRTGPADFRQVCCGS